MLLRPCWLQPPSGVSQPGIKHASADVMTLFSPALSCLSALTKRTVQSNLMAESSAQHPRQAQFIKLVAPYCFYVCDISIWSASNIQYAVKNISFVSHKTNSRSRVYYGAQRTIQCLAAVMVLLWQKAATTQDSLCRETSNNHNDTGDFMTLSAVMQPPVVNLFYSPRKIEEFIYWGLASFWGVGYFKNMIVTKETIRKTL